MQKHGDLSQMGTCRAKPDGPSMKRMLKRHHEEDKQQRAAKHAEEQLIMV